MLPDILPMRPFLRELVWGGQRLETRYGKPLPPGKPIGESWEVSAYPGMSSVVTSGPQARRPLGDLVRDHGEDLLGARLHDRSGGDFPLLIKLLDAQDDLSVQVHPDDRYVLEQRLGDCGKSEAWYILHSEGGRVCTGLEDGVDGAEMRAAIQEGRVGEVLRFHEVHAGDVIAIPPGTVHAVCRGVMLYEIQQPSDLTFRIYDYDRPGPDGRPRELHTDRALDVIAFDTEAPAPRPWHELPNATDSRALLAETEYFRLERHGLAGASSTLDSGGSFAAITLLSGEAELRGGNASHPASAGDSFVIPSSREIEIARRSDARLEYLVASVP
ncbi:MAG: class I mannose-6-phosphate isomerase [Candidatus Latescibacteria bacterium]|jgi:mannose-6-phosphate isomerase|nr:class I mannose-6-phosphate isomerase [Candidatus Latescibacterota bacterium]